MPGSQTTWTRVLAGGCLWFAAFTALRPARMAEMAGAPVGEMRALALRDVASALTLVAARDPRPALVARVFLDGSDSVIYGRRRPGMLGFTLGAVAVGLIALRAE